MACASVDTEKDVGWRLKTKGEKLADGMVAARHFNTVQLQGDYVVKTSARSVLRGEMFFYSHMPPDISDLFPQLKSSSDDPPKPGDRPRAMSSMVLQEDGSFTNSSPGPGSPASRRRAEQIASMTLQRVHGVTFSHLVTNRCLTAGRLVTFLTALHRLHTSVGDPPSQIAKPEIDVCQNYLPKLRRRFEEHRALYLSLMPAAGEMYEKIAAELESYAREKRFSYSHVIHGDPVFSNVLLNDDGHVFLLDMRGELGSTLTLQVRAVAMRARHASLVPQPSSIPLTPQLSSHSAGRRSVRPLEGVPVAVRVRLHLTLAAAARARR